MKKIIFLFFFSTITFFGQKSETSLNTFSFEEAFAMQEKEERPLLIFFHTDWCKYCFTMKKNTFANPKTIELLNTNFYFVSFDAESKEDITIKENLFQNKTGTHQIVEALASKNGSISYPSTIILSAKNTIDEQIDSFLSAKQLHKLLKAYLKQQHINH